MGEQTKLIQSKKTFFAENISEQSMNLKLFISYSHRDTFYIEEFKKHIAPLEKDGSIEVWYDRSIIPGEDFQQKIDHNLEDSDIVCLFISADYIKSESCTSEKMRTLELKKQKGVSILSIILSPCGWKDVRDISGLLSLPTDGKPVSDFNDKNTAWQDVYSGLKKIIQSKMMLKQLKISEKFEHFLCDTEMLTKAHPKKENVSLDDIYTCIELDKYDGLKDYVDTLSSNDLLNNLFTDGKIIIAGEDQSGKTTLCKRIFCDLRSQNFVPVYVSDKMRALPGKMKNIISNSLHEQYDNINEKEIDLERIIPIIDDFHHAKNKERHIKDLSEYSHCVIIVDDIFSLNIKDKMLLSSFTTFRIKELKSSLRYELVEKWVSLTDKDAICGDYRDIDRKIELINTTLGRNIGKGIMPAYPFFILTTIVTYEAVNLSLDQDITSQGYCYQAFIYYYLRKRGVRNDEIDIYMNFLTELAFHMYEAKLEELNPDHFSVFMKNYSDNYNLPITLDTLLANLNEIVASDSFKNYSFRYPCFYYFFVAKSLSEHIDDPKGMERVRDILNNLHVDENAYIAVFLTHHSKNIKIFEEIERIASSLFEKYRPATLTKAEMKFFDEQVHAVVRAVLPPANVTPETERMERLKIQDEFEQSYEEARSRESIDDDDSFAKDFRKAIKTVEVLGCIIRNRAGSLEKVRLREIFLSGMNVHLRMLSSFFEEMKDENMQKEIIDRISKILNQLEDDKEAYKRSNEEKRRKNAKTLFWNINFFIMYGILYKIIHSLGSDKLNEITVDVCDEINNPASFLIKHGIFMDYNKNLQIKAIEKRTDDTDFSEIAKRAARVTIVNYCSLHKIGYRNRQRIENYLNISQKKLLPKGS